MTDIIKVDAPARKPIFEGVQGENEARSIQFDVTAWVEELGAGAVTATAKRSKDSAPYPVTVTRDGNTVTWKPTSTDTAYEGVGAFQLEYTVDSVVAKTRVWSTIIAPSLVGAGDPPDPYDDWMADLREVAADALQSEQNAEGYAEDAEAWAVGQRGGVDVPSTDPTYENNSKYWAEQSLANQYSAFPVGTESGSIASFADGADDIPVKSLKIGIEPKQAGSGTPSPSNVRAITGTSTANVFVTGANLWDEDWEQGDLNSQTGQEIPSTTYIRGKNYTPCRPNAEYYGKANSKVWLYWYDQNKNYISNTSGGFQNASRTAPATAYFFRLVQMASAYDNGTSINYPVTDTAYHAYNGHTYPISFSSAGTVYGGEVDVTSGVLTVNRDFIADLGSKSWGVGSGYGWYTLTNPKRGTTPITSGLPTEITNCFVNANNDALLVYFAPGTYADATALKTALSGVQLCFELATPTTYQLTPTEVRTLLGANNVWADTGDTDIEYRKDPTLALEELANAIVALGGNL